MFIFALLEGAASLLICLICILPSFCAPFPLGFALLRSTLRLCPVYNIFWSLLLIDILLPVLLIQLFLWHTFAICRLSTAPYPNSTPICRPAQ